MRDGTEPEREADPHEGYQGIRPAPGYPACPEHTVKTDIFRLLKCGEIGMALTETYGMAPAASISGFYFAHRDAHYFSVGKIDHDQASDMAKRRQVGEKDIANWLSPIL